MSLYRAVVVSTLLYGYKTWTLYEHHKKPLKKSNNGACDAFCVLSGTTTQRTMKSANKQALYGELPTVKRKLGHPKLRFKDAIKSSMKHCRIRPDQLEDLAQNRPGWRKVVHDDSERWQLSRIKKRRQTRLRWKQPQRATQTESVVGLERAKRD